jgi:hypothetical protein
MWHRSLFCASLSCLLLLAAPAPSGPAQKSRDKEQTIWNYDGGLQLVTDGSVPDGPCFRLTGRLTNPEFFDNLRRVDSTTGTLYRRGNDVITEFPERMNLSFVLYDHPCTLGLQPAGEPAYLTKDIIGKFRVVFAWKHGVEMRPAKEISLTSVEAHPTANYARELTENMPQRFEWQFVFDVPSKGIPLTDSLVLLIYSPDRRIIARVTART